MAAPDPNLVNFVAKLVTDPAFRAQFEADQAAVLAAANLEQAAIDAIKASDAVKVKKLLNTQVAIP